MSKISVLIPVFNVERYLKQCLDSIIGQSFQEIEVICVDDGSSDRSGAILDEYAQADSRIKVIHKKNTGYGNSMNTAIDSARGDYIVIIESDDFAEPDMLYKLHQAALESGADIVKANHFSHHQGKDRFTDWLKNYPKRQILNVNLCPKILDMADTIWTCLYKRKFLTDYKIRFHETLGASFQDISFSLQGWIYAKAVYFIPDAVLHYRIDNPDSSMHSPHKVFCVFDEYEWLEEILCDFWKAHAKTEAAFVATKYRDYFNHYHRVAAPYQYALLLRITQSLRVDMQNKRLHMNSFTQAVWNKICAVTEDSDKYFLESGKGVLDPRLTVCNFENTKIYEDALTAYLKTFPQVIVYGAGKIGSKLAEALLKKNIAISCFVETELSQGKTELMEIPIFSLQEASGLADICVAVIAATERNQYQMYENLLYYGFRNICRVDGILRKMIDEITLWGDE